MLINCPKCNSVYEISEQRVSAKGKRFKCAECGNIWTVYPKADAKPATETEVKVETQIREKGLNSDENSAKSAVKNDMDIMFSRISKDTKMLFASDSAVENMNLSRKIKHYTLNNLSYYAIIAFLLPVSIILAWLLFIEYRYEITARIPEMEYAYSQLGYESLYKGKDLVFKNVKIRSLKESVYPKFEISGKVYNAGKQTVLLLPIKAYLINSAEQIVSEQTLILQGRKLEPDFSTLFRIVLNQPALNAHKVMLKFEKI